MRDARWVRMWVADKLVRLALRIAGDEVSRAVNEGLDEYEKDLEKDYDSPLPPPVLGERAREMRAEGQRPRPRYASPPAPEGPLPGSAAARVAASREGR